MVNVPQNKNIEKQVISFLSEELGIKPDKVKKNSSLGDDFGLDGDDALELIESYSLKFNVSLEHFSYNDYFGPETSFGPISLIMHLVGKAEKLKPLYVKDLVDGASKGSL